ncbi:MAG: hypothetical protein K2X86_17090 [Cytophagaceae bacterium]|nr:hypothetical protein [Cytophagaceae bacterium]
MTIDLMKFESFDSLVYYKSKKESPAYYCDNLDLFSIENINPLIIKIIVPKKATVAISIEDKRGFIVYSSSKIFGEGIYEEVIEVENYYLKTVFLTIEFAEAVMMSKIPFDKIFTAQLGQDNICCISFYVQFLVFHLDLLSDSKMLKRNDEKGKYNLSIPLYN